MKKEKLYRYDFYLREKPKSFYAQEVMTEKEAQDYAKEYELIIKKLN